MSSKKPEKTKTQKKQPSDPSLGLDVTLTEDKIRILESEKRAFEIQLINRSEMMASVKMECDSIRQSLNEMNQKYDDEKRRNQVVTKDMTRQYKGMQDDLLNKINEREKMIQNLTDTMRELKMNGGRMMDEKDSVIKAKQNEIDQMNRRMDEMCREFASMLEICRKRILETDVMSPIHFESLERQMQAFSILK